jgi:hypothetical protein
MHSEKIARIDELGISRGREGVGVFHFILLFNLDFARNLSICALILHYVSKCALGLG